MRCRERYKVQAARERRTQEGSLVSRRRACRESKGTINQIHVMGVGGASTTHHQERTWEREREINSLMVIGAKLIALDWDMTGVRMQVRLGSALVGTSLHPLSMLPCMGHPGMDIGERSTRLPSRVYCPVYLIKRH